MPVDAGSFIEPSLFKGGVSAYADDVVAAVIEIFGDVIDLGGIAARLVSEVEAVDPYAGVAEYAVELQPKVFSVVFSWHCEGLSVPSDAGLRVLVSDSLVSMAVTCFGSVWKVHNPVMRQVYALPVRGVELRGVRTLVVDRCGLCQVVEILCSAAEVLGWR